MSFATRISASCLVALAFAAVGPASADEYKIDPVHSAAVFKVAHRGAGHVYGMIPAITGTMHIDAANPEKNSVSIVLKPESLTTFDPRRDNHLKSADFFSVKEFPEIAYKSKSWKKTGEGVYQVTGDITIIGVTKEITSEVRHTGTFTDRRGQTAAGFETEFVIDRTDFGMNFGIAAAGGLGKMITITFSVECQKQ